VRLPQIELHIPPGINYECTSCGRCCSGWAVPMTQDDYERISATDWAGVHESYAGKELFRQLKKHESEGTPYTHKIVSETGVCPFLVDNLCFMHSQHGAEFKPSICQLFPYCFSQTPTGIYATVSFVSVGAIYNSGKPLAEQREALEQKYAEFLRMYPTYTPDWSKIKLTVDKPLTWEQYLDVEQHLLEILERRDQPLEQRLADCSTYLVSRARGDASTRGGASSVSGALKPLDLSLLLTFHRMYYPTKTLKRGEADFNVMALLRQHCAGGKKLLSPKKAFSVDELHHMQWPDDAEINGILDRYFYSYIFGKKYFGAGFGQVSVIAGFHHLILMHCLLKLQSKLSARLRDSDTVNLLDVASTVRQMERQVGETKLGGYSAAAWELLLFSPGRARRLLDNC
jgi:Fe-S-cluster containining protein